MTSTRAVPPNAQDATRERPVESRALSPGNMLAARVKHDAISVNAMRCIDEFEDAETVRTNNYLTGFTLLTMSIGAATAMANSVHAMRTACRAEGSADCDYSKSMIAAGATSVVGVALSVAILIRSKTHLTKRVRKMDEAYERHMKQMKDQESRTAHPSSYVSIPLPCKTFISEYKALSQKERATVRKDLDEETTAMDTHL